MLEREVAHNITKNAIPSLIDWVPTSRYMMIRVKTMSEHSGDMSVLYNLRSRHYDGTVYTKEANYFMIALQRIYICTNYIL